MTIPFLSFKSTNDLIKPQMLEAFESFFDSGHYVLGSKVSQFENEYAELNKVKHSVLSLIHI